LLTFHTRNFLLLDFPYQDTDERNAITSASGSDLGTAFVTQDLDAVLGLQKRLKPYCCAVLKTAMASAGALPRPSKFASVGLHEIKKNSDAIVEIPRPKFDPRSVLWWRPMTIAEVNTHIFPQMGAYTAIRNLVYDIGGTTSYLTAIALRLLSSARTPMNLMT
jgi:hypothetical protein